MSADNLHPLSDSLSAQYNDDDGSVTLYDTVTYSPDRIETLTSDEMNALMDFWTDGCCLHCLEEIPEGHILCDDCFRQEYALREVNIND